MFVKNYVKKPVKIQAILFTKESIRETIEFLCDSIDNYNACFETPYEDMIKEILTREYLLIGTLEGDMKANFGDYIIKGIEGEYYPCKAYIFNQMYEEVE